MSWIVGQAIINGLLAGGIYALISTGVTIIFGVMKMINFAMGEFLMIGMYMTWIGYAVFGGNGYTQVLFAIAAMVVTAYVCFRLTIEKLLGRSSTAYILMTVGLSFFLQNLMQIIFGPNYKTIPSSINTQSIYVGEYSISVPKLIAFICALVLIFVISEIMNRTSLGRVMRATAEKTNVAEMLGIDTKRTFTIAFIMGIVLAGIAGLLLTPIYDIKPTAGTIFKSTALMIVVLGGEGSIKGAFICGMFVGLVEQLVATFISPDLGPAAIFVFFLLVVYFRPQGLFGQRRRTV
ncbi:branched-chain amino acid ABC transporter permease [Oscillospiraceae bacterium MB08-C2-2]|nr:branched-chain amino acid ABC transporter permease [Oscillospiraceae bacterium MB08-C2-2]